MEIGTKVLIIEGRFKGKRASMFGHVYYSTAMSRPKADFITYDYGKEPTEEEWRKHGIKVRLARAKDGIKYVILLEDMVKVIK